MNYRKSRRLCVALGAALFGGLSNCVNAADFNGASGAQIEASSPSVTNSPSGSTGLEEIIVTAQRRDESLSRTPVSVSVVSSDELSKANITTNDDLHAVVPGLTVRSTANSNQINYAIRGQSRDAFSGTRPGVLPYINEVQIGGDGASVFYDLQSIQVLEGPQGTLFGRSATGGAVLETTAKPTDRLEGYISALGGNYGAQKYEGALNVPILDDRLMARIAGFFQKRDGFQTNTENGQDIGGLDRWGIRASLSANFGLFHNDFMIDYFNSNSQNTVGVISGLQIPGSLVPLSLLYAGNSTPIQQATGVAVFQALTGLDSATATAAYNAYFAQPNHPNTGLAAFLTQQQSQGPFKAQTDDASSYRAHNLILTNGTTIDLNDDLKLRNIAGYVDLTTNYASDQDGTPYDINVNPGNPQDTIQRSEEVQLQGKALNGKLNYVSGVYYSSESETVNNSNSPAVVFDILFGGVKSQSNFTYLNTTYAGYSQGTYAINDEGLAGTLGLRYTSEKAVINIKPGDEHFLPTQPPGFANDQSSIYHKLSWQAGLQDQVTNDLLVYAVSRRAYKSGGYNGSVQPLIGNGANGGNAYNAEQLTDAELGAKYAGRIAGMPTRISTSLYYDWGENAQRTSYSLIAGNVSAVTLNVPMSNLYGAEIQATVQPQSWLAVGASFDYFHASLSGVTPGATALPGCRGATVNSNGDPQCFDRYADTPSRSGSLFADVTAPLTPRLDYFLHADVFTESSMATAPQSANAAGTTIGSYALTNFRFGLTDNKAGWTLTANVKNALNRVYYVGGIPAGLLYQINTLIPGEPRTFTVEMRVKF